MRLRDKQVTRVTNHEATDLDPDWSPDGRRLLFYSDRDGNWEIYMINIDGTGLTRLTHDDAEDKWPAWRP